VRAQAAIDRFTSNAYDLVIESWAVQLSFLSIGSGDPEGGVGTAWV